MNSDPEDESDEELASLILPQTREIRTRPNHFQIWNDAQFYDRFRISKQTANMILSTIAPMIENKTNWNSSLSAEQMFLITLRFYASGGMFISLGDFFGVCKAIFIFFSLIILWITITLEIQEGLQEKQ